MARRSLAEVPWICHGNLIQQLILKALLSLPEPLVHHSRKKATAIMQVPLNVLGYGSGAMDVSPFVRAGVFDPEIIQVI